MTTMLFRTPLVSVTMAVLLLVVLGVATGRVDGSVSLPVHPDDAIFHTFSTTLLNTPLHTLTDSDEVHRLARQRAERLRVLMKQNPAKALELSTATSVHLASSAGTTLSSVSSFASVSSFSMLPLSLRKLLEHRVQAHAEVEGVCGLSKHRVHNQPEPAEYAQHGPHGYGHCWGIATFEPHAFDVEVLAALNLHRTDIIPFSFNLNDAHHSHILRQVPRSHFAVDGIVLGESIVFRDTPAVELMNVINTRIARLFGFAGPRRAMTTLATICTSTNPNKTNFGNKKPIIINVDFSDVPGQPNTDTTTNTVIAASNTFLVACSFSQVSVTGQTITTTFRLPQVSSYYTGSSSGYSYIKRDSQQAATDGGHNLCSYDIEIYSFKDLPGWGWAGLGTVGGKSVWINGAFDEKVVCHEIGHNFRLQHASFWQVTTNAPLSTGGANAEYGDNYDMMGYGYAPRAHFNAMYKAKVGWITAGSEYTSVGGASGQTNKYTGRLWPSDDIRSRTHLMGLSVKRLSTATPDVQKIPGFEYWLSQKSLYAGNVAQLFVHIAGGPDTPPQSWLLDMHGDATKSIADAGLNPGETFSDCAESIHVTNEGYVTCASDSTYKCIDYTVSRATPSSQRLEIQMKTKPTSTFLNTAFTVAADGWIAGSGSDTAYTDKVAWDFGDGAGFVFGGSVTYVYTSSAVNNKWVTIKVSISDRQGAFTQYAWAIKVGTTSAAAPTTTAVSFKYTCATGYSLGYSGDYVPSASTAGPTAAPTAGPTAAPTAGPDPTPVPGVWDYGGWGVCSKTCNGGEVTRIVKCMQNGVAVPDATCCTAGATEADPTKCPAGPKLATTTRCNTQPCEEYAWKCGDFGACTCSASTKPTCAYAKNARSRPACGCYLANTFAQGLLVAANKCLSSAPATTVLGCATDTQVLSDAATKKTNLVTGVTVSASGVSPVQTLHLSDTAMITWTYTGTVKFARILIVSATPSLVDSVVSFYTPNTGSYEWFLSSELMGTIGVGLHQVIVSLLPTTADVVAGAITPPPPVNATSASFFVEDPCKTIGLNCGNGQCVLGKCTCFDGYTGTNCNVNPKNKCNGVTCRNGGSCSADTGTCTGCSSGFGGAYCDVATETCPASVLSSPCLNKGTYADSTCSTCTCVGNWQGASCSTCGLSTCKNGRRATDCQSCTCAPYYFGTSCEYKYQVVSVRIVGVAVAVAQANNWLGVLAQQIAGGIHLYLTNTKTTDMVAPAAASSSASLASVSSPLSSVGLLATGAAAVTFGTLTTIVTPLQVKEGPLDSATQKPTVYAFFNLTESAEVANTDLATAIQAVVASPNDYGLGASATGAGVNFDQSSVLFGASVDGATPRTGDVVGNSSSTTVSIVLALLFSAIAVGGLWYAYTKYRAGGDTSSDFDASTPSSSSSFVSRIAAQFNGSAGGTTSSPSSYYSSSVQMQPSAVVVLNEKTAYGQAVFGHTAQPQPQMQGGVYGQPQMQGGVYGQPQMQGGVYGQPQMQGRVPPPLPGMAAVATLPPFWTQQFTEDGIPYYWNSHTNESMWEVPTR